MTEQNKCDGMSLRDYFAAKALAGMYANTALLESASRTNAGAVSKALARMAYEQADAMLEAKEQE